MKLEDKEAEVPGSQCCQWFAVAEVWEGIAICVFVRVSSGCWRNIPHLVSFNSQHLSCTVLEPGSQDQGAGSSWQEPASCLPTDSRLFAVSLPGGRTERERALICLPLLQRHKPHREGRTLTSSSNLITSQSVSKCHHNWVGVGGWGRASACEFRGTQFSPQQCSCRFGDWPCWGLETFSWTMPSSEPPTLFRYLK